MRGCHLCIPARKSCRGAQTCGLPPGVCAVSPPAPLLICNGHVCLHCVNPATNDVADCLLSLWPRDGELFLPSPTAVSVASNRNRAGAVTVLRDRQSFVSLAFSFVLGPPRRAIQVRPAEARVCPTVMHWAAGCCCCLGCPQPRCDAAPGSANAQRALSHGWGCALCLLAAAAASLSVCAQGRCASTTEATENDLHPAVLRAVGLSWGKFLEEDV